MPWARLDDDFILNEKLFAVSSDAKVLWFYSIGYSNKNLTDGSIRQHALPVVAAMAGVKDYEAAAAELVGARLYERIEGGYLVHDFLKFNPSREDVLKQREENAKRQAEWQARKRGEASDLSDIIDEPPNTDTNTVANTVSNAVSKSAPVPVPVPDPVPDPVPVPRPEATRTPPQAAARRDAPPKPVPAQREAFGRLVELWGKPANDGEKGKYERAAKLLAQANAVSEIAQLKAEAERRDWPECTPLAVATNVTILRKPRVKTVTQGGRARAPTSLAEDFDRIDRVAAMVERGGSFFGDETGADS